MRIIFVQNAKIQHSKRREHKRQRIFSYFDFKELQHFGIHHTHKKQQQPQSVWSTQLPPPHLELSLRELNEKQRYVIVSKGDYLWLGNSYFRPCNTSLRCIRAVTLFHSMKRCCEWSPVNLPLSANPLEEGGMCLFGRRERSAAVQTHLCFQRERGTRPPPNHFLIVHMYRRGWWREWIRRDLSAMVTLSCYIKMSCYWPQMHHFVAHLIWCMFGNVMKRWSRKKSWIFSVWKGKKTIGWYERKSSGCRF